MRSPLETAALEYIVRRWMQWIDLYCTVYFQRKAGLWYLSPVYIKLQSKYAARPPLIMWLCRGTKKKKLREEKSLSGVLFLITQRASALHISSAASPQVIPVLSLYCHPLPHSLLPPPPTRRHRWHWLRCAKNLLMCLNYLRLMLGAKRLQQCPGTALFLWWKFFEDHSFASYFVALPREMPRGSEAIRNTLINS